MISLLPFRKLTSVNNSYQLECTVDFVLSDVGSTPSAKDVQRHWNSCMCWLLTYFLALIQIRLRVICNW